MTLIRKYFDTYQRNVFLDAGSISKGTLPFEVIIKVKYCGICNSDIKEVAGKRIKRRDFGHELLGTIVDTHNFDMPIGTCVTIDPHVHITRGTCFSNFVKIGSTDIKLLCDAIFKVPALEVKYTLIEPLGCAFHAVKRLLAVRNDYRNILVYGSGTFGVLIYLILKSKGFKVSLSNRSSPRLFEMKSKFEQLSTFEIRQSCDVFDAIAITQSFVTFHDIESLTSAMDEDSNVLLFGAVCIDEKMDLYRVRNDEKAVKIRVNGRNITAIGSLGANRQDFLDAIAMIQDKYLGELASKIVSRIVNPEEGMHIINSTVQGQDYFGKTIVDFESLWV